MIRGLYLRERKAHRRQRNLKLIALILIFFVVYKIILGSFSLYESNAKSNADVNLAYFVLDDVYNTSTIPLEELLPGDDEEFTFTVANYFEDDEGNKTLSDTDVKYKLTIRTTTNLPLNYKVYKGGEGPGNLVASISNTNLSNVVQDEYDTYFNKIYEEEKIFYLYGEDGTATDPLEWISTFHVKIEYPEYYPLGENINAKYSDTVDMIEIIIDGSEYLGT